MSLPKSQEHEELELAVNAVAADLADYTQLALDLKEAQQRIAQGDGQLKFAHVPLGMGCSVEGVVSVILSSFRGRFDADTELARNRRQPRLIQLTVLKGCVVELTIPESISFIAKKLPILNRSATI